MDDLTRKRALEILHSKEFARLQWSFATDDEDYEGVVTGADIVDALRTPEVSDASAFGLYQDARRGHAFTTVNRHTAEAVARTELLRRGWTPDEHNVLRPPPPLPR